MIPDLPYFLPLGVTRVQSHSLPGLFWFCLPAGLVAWSAYRVILRPFAIALLPAGVARRLAPRLPPFSTADVSAAGVSVLVGAVTHVAWDSFTHGSGVAVQALPALRVPVRLFDGYMPRVFTLLQHVSTVLGLSLLAFWGVRWYRNAKADRPPYSRPLPTWLRGVTLMAMFLPSMAAGLLVIWPRLSGAESSFQALQQAIRWAALSAGRVFLMMLMLISLAWRVVYPSRLGE